MFSLQDAIYLIELALYCPIIPAIIFILIIHGGKKPYSWRPIVIPLFIIAGLRIAGASMGLTAINPDKSSLLSTATLLETIGLAPVLCLLIGLLIRANAPIYRGLPIFAFLPLQLLTIAATAMTAYGGRDLYSNRDHQTKDLQLMRAGIVLFISAFIITVTLGGVTLMKVREKCYRTERTSTVCAILCVPFMAVRLAYSAGSLFSGEGSVLSMLGTSDTDIWVNFLMVIVMEYVVTLSATAVALTARRVVVMEVKKDPLEDEA
ncbi:hypothetical protein ASPWEDRAFT_102071 [Aspergillus wentii DTO 134E9]|uniref:DUF7702 domain-containing protein n=1 Tax=Aspergillus wentii DTO 134E9 TaxID=1073089 RepID=A0A1L9RZ03_ASPWE|nr:uncharacterized protein ASPWEDRAFT_102071 [Aspergillus wentii DTO 134E9]OJJ40145.1 hypothetical protein ASPWEDRAFT_102071 [Aspergillus wentii DTO 134E9]